MISYCGLNCEECEAFLATKNNDDQKRAEVAKLWSEQYNADLKPSDINCEGCQSDGTNVFSHCNVCEIRKCALEKNIENCAHCDDYSCEKVEMVLSVVPDARKRLDEIRSNL